MKNKKINDEWIVSIDKSIKLQKITIVNITKSYVEIKYSNRMLSKTEYYRLSSIEFIERIEIDQKHTEVNDFDLFQ